MRWHEELYCNRKKPDYVNDRLNHYLLLQIYSLLVIRAAAEKWKCASPLLLGSTPPKIRSLIEQSHDLSDQKVKNALNQYLLENAIDVLTKYQSCLVPLTEDPTVERTMRKLTSEQGDRNLQILRQASNDKRYTDEMADLAVKCSHKFLFDDKNFRQWPITAEFARDCAISYEHSLYSFPTLQLTKGCPNGCSHCDCRAENHLSHMPWPVFVNLYKGFYAHYKHYHQGGEWYYFSQFFGDSDMLTYYDSIMNADSGDAALFVRLWGNGLYNVMTRGVKDERMELALQKVLIAGNNNDQVQLLISFVDADKENMQKNTQQLCDTLKIIKEFPFRSNGLGIMHLHLKSGPTVDLKDILQSVGFDRDEIPVKTSTIYALGRAKNYPDNEIEHYPDNEFIPHFVFLPNGKICLLSVENGEITLDRLNSLYGVHRQKKRFSFGSLLRLLNIGKLHN